MKVLEKISLTIFSILILIESLILIIMLFGWINIDNVLYVFDMIKANPTATNITLVISVAFILLAIKCICYPSYSSENSGKSEGILLENENGKLLISIETLENLTKGVIVEFPSVLNANCKVKLDKQVNNVLIDLNLVVSNDTVIKDLSMNLQDRIKEVIKTTTEIEVKEINIKIKNIETPKE